MTIITDEIKAELTGMYSAPNRVYHGLSHIEALLALLQRHRDAFADAEAVEAAIWFHDSIYDTRAKGSDNELRSAELAVARLGGGDGDGDGDGDGVVPERLARIRDMIEATATHTVPQVRDPLLARDAALFLDMDMSILGVDEAAFDEYEAAVRREYAWVDDAGWRTGRGAVLTGFLARPRIYHSDLFHGLCEEKARRNMERSLAKLRAS